MKHVLAMALTSLALSPSAWAGETVDYQVGPEPFQGYWAQADDARGTIIILPTWNGLSDYEKDRANMLTGLGMNAFAADLYQAGSKPTNMAEKQAGLAATVSDQDRMHALLAASISEAKARSDGPLFVMGYSMGALVAMELAWSGLGNELDLDGYIIFSGRVSDGRGRMMPDDVAPFFLAIGASDERVPVSSIAPFVDDVELSGGHASVHIFPGAGHLFSAFGFPNYDADADAQSWARLTEFLDKNLGS